MSTVVIWIVKVIVLFAILFETTNVAYSSYTAIKGGISNLSSIVYTATEGAPFLLALLDVYASLAYLPSRGSKSLVMLLEAGLSYVIREILIQFHAGHTDFATLSPIGLLVLALGVTLYIASRINRESDYIG